MQFDWLDFDGDDCFNDFHIKVTTEADTRRFDFGPCVVSGLRRVSKFFRDETQSTTSGGFRHPDIRRFDLHRAEDGYRLVVRFEDSGLHEQFHIQRPLLQIDDDFLRQY